MTKSTTIFLVIGSLASIAMLQECRGFAPTSTSPRSLWVSGIIASDRSPSLFLVQNANVLRLRTNHRSNNHWTTRKMAAAGEDVAFLSNDPFVILGLDGTTADKKVLKRAYKKRALKFHPDVVTDIHSTPEEKKKASDRFAKINGAYEQLMGKGKGNGRSGDDDATSSSSTSGGWTPPHRRTSSYKSSSSGSSYSGGASTDWRDYMPDYRKDSDADYDTGGDSFSQIFSDAFTGAASAAVSGGMGGLGGGIFNEFLEFLEGGSSGFSGGYGGGSEDDADLRELLRTGTLEEIADEMDDTEMVVKQLETKSKALDDEVFAMDAEAKMTSRFSEKIELEEKGAELKARKDVVNGYMERARKRLLSLQTRYKDLIAYGGANDDYAASGGRWGSRRSSWKDARDEATNDRPSSSTSQNSSSSSSSSYGARTEASSTRGGSTSEESSDDETWMNEGFGSSSGRSRGRRGSGRRRASSRSRASASSVGAEPPRPTSATASSYSTTGASNDTSRSSRPPPTSTAPSPSPSTSSSAVSKSNYSDDVPPHRRTTGSSSFYSRQEEDRKRMEEIKVDEEFEKLKKELGL